MEEQNDNHSDSDSGESWTLLESSPSYATNIAQSPLQATANNAESDKDEDTDGISVISDCESEHTYDHVSQEETPAEQTECITTEPIEEGMEAADNCSSLKQDERNLYNEVLGDSSKLKTYVHKRNNKVSSMLNVILLGSVITAAGIALGHMWGIREDCTQHKFPSVNKILSNLYKLQEENEFLRSKLKELTLATHTQYQLKKSVQKQNKCKKLVEEPLNSVNVVKTTKCIDPDLDSQRPILDFVKTELALPFDSLEDNAFEKEIIGEEFKNDVKKLKNFYKENKKWLDKEINKRLKVEKRMQYNQDRLTTGERPNLEQNKFDEVNSEMEIDPENISTEANMEHKSLHIVSYADSLKNPHVRKNNAEDAIQSHEERKSRTNRSNNKKIEKRFEKNEVDFSEDEDLIPTEKRRFINKYKSDRHRIDRKSRYKKEKRGNKYQQWEMKGGYLKDYDSVPSLKSDDIPLSDVNNNRMSQDWEIYVTYVNKKENEKKKKKDVLEEKKTDFVIVNKTNKEKSDSTEQTLEQTLDEDWFDRRSSSRRHAREIESDIPTNLKYKINSRWYFRRMSDREKLRTSIENDKRPKSQRRNYKTRR